MKEKHFNLIYAIVFFILTIALGICLIIGNTVGIYWLAIISTIIFGVDGQMAWYHFKQCIKYRKNMK